MSSGQLNLPSFQEPDLELCLHDGCRKLRGHAGKHDRYPNLLINLPEEIRDKINKTIQTRGAQPYERVPYQNRVGRWNRAVVPLRFKDSRPPEGFENGFVIMVRPTEYFDATTGGRRADFPEDVHISGNAFVYYSTRSEWMRFPPLPEWEPCRHIDAAGNVHKQRELGGIDVGHYIARVPATTAAKGGDAIVKGEAQGIRFFEYASFEECWRAKLQLAYLAWHTVRINEVAAGRMPLHLRIALEHEDLINLERLYARNIIDGEETTICPLCREPIEARKLMERMAQAEGREVADLTVTEANLFHLDDLKPGYYNHRTYKLGWGHHHCNTVAQDHGIEATLDWMENVLIKAGRLKKPL